MLGGADELFARGVAAVDRQMERRTVLGPAEVPAGGGGGKVEAVGVHLVDGGRAHDAALDERDASLRQTFEIERKREEGRIERVVGQREIRADDLLADVVDEERGAVVVRRAAERDQVHPVDHFRGGRRFEDDVVRARLDVFDHVAAERRFERRFVAQRDDVDVGAIDGGRVAGAVRADGDDGGIGRSHRAVAPDAV